MPISEIPILSMLRTKMQWHQQRQRLLAENVSNADTPRFAPRDLAPLKLDGRTAQSGLALTRTSAAHIDGTSSAGTAQFPAGGTGSYEIRPAGNAVSLEDEMMKVAANQMDYQAAATLYGRSFGLIKSALGKR